MCARESRKEDHRENRAKRNGYPIFPRPPALWERVINQSGTAIIRLCRIYAAEAFLAEAFLTDNIYRRD